MNPEPDHGVVLLLTGALVALAILIKWGLEKTAMPRNVRPDRDLIFRRREATMGPGSSRTTESAFRLRPYFRDPIEGD